MPKGQEGLSVHKHAFWLYGVVVGLVIKEAVTNVSEHIFPIAPRVSDEFHYQVAKALGIALAEPLPSTATMRLTDGCRLIIVLTICIRFYLGAAVYFESTYFEHDGSLKPTASDKDYMVDFVWGFVHFMLFLGLSATIEGHGQPTVVFPILLAVVFGYSIAWYFGTGKNHDEERLIVRWATINALTLLIGGLTYFIIYTFNKDKTMAEWGAFIWVFGFSIFDIIETIMRRPLLENFFNRFSKHKQQAQTIVESQNDPSPSSPPLTLPPPPVANFDPEQSEKSQSYSIFSSNKETPQEYIGNLKNKLYHLPGCANALQITKNKKIIFFNIDHAIANDYTSAEKVCVGCKAILRRKT